jgi:hypothetical protein
LDLDIKVRDTVTEYAIEVAGIRIGVKSVGDHFGLFIDPPHESFLVPTENLDIDLTLHYENPPKIEKFDEHLFDSEAYWNLYRLGNQYVLITGSPELNPDIPLRMIIFNEDFTKGDIYVRPEKGYESRKDTSGKPAIRPFEHPLDEFLIVNKVSDGRGANIHSCGVVLNDEGMLFVGVSTAGKSTIANLWKERDVKILSDDRIIVKTDDADSRFWMHGTPWHGDAKVSAPDGVPLKGVFFITKSDENYLRKLPQLEAVTRLFVCCFPTFYFKNGVENTMTVLEKLAGKVPVYEFGYKPDQKALDFVIEETSS